MPHALTANLEVRHLHSAAVTDNTLVPDGFELAAVAFPLLGGSENALTEEPVLFGAQGPVVDCFRFFDLTVGPCSDLVRRGQFYHNTVKILYISHSKLPKTVNPAG